MPRSTLPVRAFLPVLTLVLATMPPASAQLEAPAARAPCDPLDQALCLLPFPNDRFTRSDAITDTGRRIDFQLVEMPRSIAGKPIDPAEWNRNDGFSPGAMILTFVPGLDLHRTWGAESLPNLDPVEQAKLDGPNDPRDHVADIGRYLAPDAPILLIDAQTGERWPFWSELDMNAATPPDQRMLIIRPAVNYCEGHTYLVALRNLKDAQSHVIPAGAQFAAYRDGTPGPAADPTFEESRRAEVNDIINRIRTAELNRIPAHKPPSCRGTPSGSKPRPGNTFDRSALYLAWKFTVASERNLSERALHIRNDAFAQLGDANLADGVIAGNPPRFQVTKITDKPGNPSRLRQIEGTIMVPNYLDRPPQPLVEQDPITGLPQQAVVGARFVYGPDGLPMQNPALPTIDVPFVCTIPRAATAANPAHPTLYGHGLLGSRFESTGGSTDRDRERGFMPCAVNWMGFANYDVANALETLMDPSNMSSMADRSQQGFVNFLYLGRALAHPRGLATDPAFQDGEGRPLFKTGELFYDGNSQGGIMGGALTALSVDFTRSVLGVTGMNYSTLLNRSSDWEGPLVNPSDPGFPSFSSFLYTMFPNKQEQQLVMALLQMLWDRADADGYARHMTGDPLPDTPPHRVLMHAAFGDFQVTNFAAEVEARTIGARVMDTALLPGRHWAIHPYFGLEPIPKDDDGKPLPWPGSAFIYWDSGNLPPPNANIPPSEEGGDPHEDPRRDPRGGDQKAQFYQTGDVIDVMNGGPYLTCRPGAEDQIPRVPSQFTFDWCTK